MKLILILTFLFSCSVAETKQNYQIPELLAEFKRDSGIKEINTTFSFDDLQTDKKRVIGTCNLFTNHVTFDRTFWWTSSNIRRKALFYHELGHCVFMNLFHNDGELKDGCPKSIMSSVMAKETCYKKHWDYYLREMFE